MKCNVNRLLSLALVLVMLVGILPLTAKPVEAEDSIDSSAYTFGDVLFEDNFDLSTLDNETTPTKVNNTDKNVGTKWDLTKVDGSTNTFSLENDSHGGQYAHWTKKGDSSANFGLQLKGNFKFTVGEKYRLQFRAKGDQVELYFRIHNGSGYLDVGKAGLITFTDTWETYTYDMEIVDGTGTDLRVLFCYSGDRTGDVCIDDITFTRLNDAAPVADSEVLYDMDFSATDGFEGWSSGTNGSTFVYDSESDAVKMTYGTGTAYSQEYFTANVRTGNTYFYEVWLSEKIGTYYFYVGGAVKDNGGWQGGSTASVYSSRKDGDWIVYTLRYQPTAAADYMRMLIGFTGATQGDTCYFKRVRVTEVWSLENAITYGQQIKLMADTQFDTDLGSTGKLDLNGYKLTASYVNGTEGSEIYDSSAAKTGRIDADVVSLSPANPDLPVKDADGNYALADVNLGAAYMQQLNATENGFTLVFRPGFGTKDIVSMVASGDSGVTMSLNISWTDVWGESPAEPTVITGFDSFVQSAYTKGKAIYAWFTNPGDTYKFTIQIVVESPATGVAIKSDVASDVDATYINPIEAAKTYLFAHNFDGNLSWQDTNKLYSMRDSSKYIDFSISAGTYVDPILNGTELAMPSDTYTHQINFNVSNFLPKVGGKLVLEMDVRIEVSAAEKTRVDFCVRNTSATGTQQYRQQILFDIGAMSRQVGVGDHSLPATPGTSSSNDVKVTNETVVGYITDAVDEYTTLKMILDYDNMTISISLDDGEPVTKTMQDFNNSSFNILRWTNYDGMFIDWMKIYHVAS